MLTRMRDASLTALQGAIIIVGVLQLFDFREWCHLWVISKLDWLVWNAVFLFVRFLVSQHDE